MKLSQKRLARPSMGGLLATRQGALALALLCAVMAAAILVFAMGRYQKSVQVPTKQDTVLIATGEIQKGTSGSAVATQGLFKSTPILATQVVPGAIYNAADLQGKIAASDILPGQQLTETDFTAPGGVLSSLAPNQGAISVAIDEAHGDTDVLAVGDSVDVYGAFPGAGKGGQPVVAQMIAHALVLKPATSSSAAGATTGAAPAAAPGATAGAPTGASLVLRVSSAQAPAVAYAAEYGKLWIVLRPANATPALGGITTLDTILAASTASSLSSANSNQTGKHP